MQKVMIIVAAAAAALAPVASGSSIAFWSVAHAQKALHTMKLAPGTTVTTVTCRGTSRGRMVAGARSYSSFRCTVSGQQQNRSVNVAANVDVAITGRTTYRILRCQTASMPLTAKVCAGP